MPRILNPMRRREPERAVCHTDEGLVTLSEIRRRYSNEDWTNHSAYDALPQPRGVSFHYAPHLLSHCNHTALHDFHTYRRERPWLTRPNLPLFMGTKGYCAGHARNSTRWPACPPTTWPPLRTRELMFLVMTSEKLINSRARTLVKALELQGARYMLFSEHETPGVIRLPEAARIGEAMKAPKSLPLYFIAQKYLEMLASIEEPSEPVRWWLIADDDTFFFVERWMAMLSQYDDQEALYIGAGASFNQMCSQGKLCNHSVFLNSQVITHAGGPGMALSNIALHRMQRSIAAGACLDGVFGDQAIGFCALVSNVTHGFSNAAMLINDGLYAFMPGRGKKGPMPTGFKKPTWPEARRNLVKINGRILSYHRLLQHDPEGPTRILCWARYGECDPRCDCDRFGQGSCPSRAQILEGAENRTRGQGWATHLCLGEVAALPALGTSASVADRRETGHIGSSVVVPLATDRYKAQQRLLATSTSPRRDGPDPARSGVSTPPLISFRPAKNPARHVVSRPSPTPPPLVMPPPPPPPPELQLPPPPPPSLAVDEAIVRRVEQLFEHWVLVGGGVLVVAITVIIVLFFVLCGYHQGSITRKRHSPRHRQRQSHSLEDWRDPEGARRTTRF